jgi:hypothetical protein
MPAALDLPSWMSSAAVTAVLAVALPASPASAQRTVAPPGNSGVDQYFEVVPDAGGGAQPRPERRNVLPAEAQRRLEQRGSAGRDVLRLVDATTPDRSRSQREPRAREGDRENRRPQNRRAPLAAGANSILGKQDGGMGLLLPLLIGGATLGIGAFALWRRGWGGAGPGDA